MKTAKIVLPMGQQTFISNKEYPVIEEIPTDKVKLERLQAKIIELRNVFQKRVNLLKHQLEENLKAKPENKMNPRLVANTRGHLAEAELVVFEINKRFKL